MVKNKKNVEMGEVRYLLLFFNVTVAMATAIAVVIVPAIT